jgi:hypothetical protein
MLGRAGNEALCIEEINHYKVEEMRAVNEYQLKFFRLDVANQAAQNAMVVRAMWLNQLTRFFLN